MFENVNDKQTLLKKVKELFDESGASNRDFQTRAKESFAFRDNDQWKSEEKSILEEERRPALTFNVVKAHVDLIVGLNEDLKKRYVARPVAVEDGFLCDVLNNVVYWAYQKANWESEEDRAFESALISGRGWVGIDYDIDETNIQEIKITQSFIPVHEVRFDPSSTNKDLSDASYIIWDRWFTLEDFCVKYPSKASLAKDAFTSGHWPKTANEIMLPAEDPGSASAHDINDESDYSDPLNISYFEIRREQIRVCHMEYWKHTKKHFFWHPQTRIWVPVPGDLKVFKQDYPMMFPNTELTLTDTNVKEVWWLQFCGEDILVHTKSPINYPGFSIVPCFMFADSSGKSCNHYGPVELMKDGQRELNKRISQTLNLFNQQVQPGVYAEAQAFLNTDQAEQSLKEAGSVTWLKDGALSQKRFQERTIPQFPSAVLQMGEYAREMMRHVTGINPDLLGMNDKRREAGIVVQLRQQQGMAILKPVFRAYTDMKKGLFERQIRIIMDHMPTGQIKKIMGEGDRYQVEDDILTDAVTGLQCNFRDTNNVSYDVDTEVENNSMTQNSLELATFMELQQAGMPVDPKVIIQKTNLPTSEKIHWIEYIEAQQKGASEAAQQEAQLEARKVEIELELGMARIQADKEINVAKLKAASEKELLRGSLTTEELAIQAQAQVQQSEIELLRIMAKAKTDDESNKTQLLKIILNADHAMKKLILDVLEVMAMAQMAGDKLQGDLVLTMFKEAMNAENIDNVQKTELIKKAIDAMVKLDVEAIKAKNAAKKVE